jgi:hypothetical protein
VNSALIRITFALYRLAIKDLLGQIIWAFSDHRNLLEETEQRENRD